MDEAGIRALLAFYNQTYHGMTMAACLQSTGSAFIINTRLAENMAENSDAIIRALQENIKYQHCIGAWEQARNWLRNIPTKAFSSDHSSELYELNALAFATWSKLCDYPNAQRYADEHYTVVAHPDQHPGTKAIKRIWSNPSRSGNTSTQATLLNLAAIAEGKIGSEQVNHTSHQKHGEDQRAK